MNPHLYSLKTRFSDTDSYGVCHHSNYFCWLEESRFSVIDSYFQEEMDLFEAIQFPVIAANGKYKHAIYASEDIEIEVILERPKSAKLIFHYKIRNQDGQLCFEGSTDHVFIKDQKLMLRVPEAITSKIDGLWKKGDLICEKK